MPVLKIESAVLQYGEQVLFDHIELQLEKGDKLCIVGRNGVGKSSLLKCIEGLQEFDSGSVWRESKTVIAGLMQDLPEAGDESVFDFVAEGLGELGAALREYEHLIHSESGHKLKELERLHGIIDAQDGWSFQNKIEQVLSKLDLDGESQVRSLSGGWRRRAALARCLVRAPDVLLLDEPTNHLDIAAIQWLEQFLREYQGALVFITHDRAFLRAVANRIAELDRGALLQWDGDYKSFLAFKEQRLETEAKHNALFDKKLAQEEVWIRQGIKARRTRNEGRVRALKKLREERSERRSVMKRVKMSHDSQLPSGKIVAELKNVSFYYDDASAPMIKEFDTVIQRGDKIGLIGPNGIGKTTFLKVVLGELAPTEGRVKLGSKLEIAYFDQTRAQLELEKSAIDNIAGGRDTIECNGKPKNIYSYLQDFLFTGERARTPIKSLSGGERNRILLAKLFSQSSNVLIMDEPTNDLDAETLDLLEDLLVEYSGTVLLVTHDREFLDNVVTQSIAFEGGGRLQEYVGGYHDWLRQGGRWPDASALVESHAGDTSGDTSANASESQVSPTPNAPAGTETAKNLESNDTSPKKTNAKKLSYKLQRELDALPAQLERLESELARLHETVSAPDFYQGDQDDVAKTMRALTELEADLKQKYERWETLESM